MIAHSPVLPSSPQFPESVLAKGQKGSLPLPVARVLYTDGARSMISCYRLSWRERMQILLTGKVWWEQMTFGGRLQQQRMGII